jgi:hypothetical protein
MILFQQNLLQVLNQYKYEISKYKKSN